MEKRHYYRVLWMTISNGRVRSERTFSHEYDTQEEAVKKARRVDKNPNTMWVRVAEMEHWETPEPAPNGTTHVSLLAWIPWWMD